MASHRGLKSQTSLDTGQARKAIRLEAVSLCALFHVRVMKGDKVYIQAGAGLVAASDPTSEHEECINKAMAVVKAIDLAEDGGF